MMKILLLSNQCLNKDGVGNPIMYRMERSMATLPDVGEVRFMPFTNRLGCFRDIRHVASCYDVVHIHFGGLYALLLRLALIGINKPMVITFHGTDIHAKSIKTAHGIAKKLKIKVNQWASFLSIPLFSSCGFVTTEMTLYVPRALRQWQQSKFFVQRLGVDYSLFTPVTHAEACQRLGIPNRPYALFSDVSGTNIKRRDIAEAIVAQMNGEVALLRMTHVKPELVPLYISAASFLLLTSDEEGSPNIIRECLVMNKPVFSVNVGDAAKQLEGLANSAIISRDPKLAAQKISEVVSMPYTDNTRERQRAKLDFDHLNQAVVALYKRLTSK